MGTVIPSATSKGSHTGRNIGIVVVVIAVVGAIILTQSSMNGTINRPSSVNVSGQVSTKGFGTHPVNVGFTSDNGQMFNAAVVNNQYSVSLPNDHTYTVQVQWGGALGSSGTCSAGTLPVNEGPGGSGLSNNWSC